MESNSSPTRLETMSRRTAMKAGLAVSLNFVAQPLAARNLQRNDEYDKFDGLDLAELVRNGNLKPEELLDAAISRADTLNPKLNAIVTPCYELARRQIEDGLPEGAPFCGVPFVVKDLSFWMKGVRSTDGSSLYRDNVPKQDDDIVKLYRKTGLVLIGRTHSCEFGLIGSSESQLFGATKNPWDVTRSAGGSSGGTAAAVASGIVPMGSASDGGGSIRIPASCCGLFGMKPTRGRVSLGPRTFEMWEGLAVAHAITRTVRDSAALLDATCRQSGDARAYPAPASNGPFLRQVALAPRRLRIAMITENWANEDLHPECRKGVEQAGRLCESFGHSVVPADDEIQSKIPFASLSSAFGVLWLVSTQLAIDDRLAQLGRGLKDGDVEPVTLNAYERSKSITASQLIQARATIHKSSEQMAQFLANYDMILTPTLGLPPIMLGEWTLERPYNDVAKYCPFTPIANMTGQPAMTVPLHWTNNGLPVGVQFIGRYSDESTLFRLAGQLEKASPWKHRRPQL